MNIEEILKNRAMATVLSSTLAKFYDKKIKSLSSMNQTIMIRDMIVKSTRESTVGEQKRNIVNYEYPVLEKMLDQIQFFFKYINEDHRANYCEKQEDGLFRIKKGMENHVSRMVMHENYFYTIHPIKMDAFKNLYLSIEELAKDLEVNTLVLLATFSVLDPNDKVLNLAIVAQGGKPGHLAVFVKNRVSKWDMTFESYSLFSQLPAGSYEGKVSAGDVQSDYISSQLGITVSTNSVFEAWTLGNACFTNAFDICLDHSFKHSQNNILRQLSNPFSMTMKPSQIEQCVTSNSTYLSKDAILAKKVVHADTAQSTYQRDDSNRQEMEFESTSISQENLESLISSDKYDTILSKENYGCTGTCPPFGPDFILYSLKERKVETYLPKFSHLVDNYNKQVIDSQLLASNPGIDLKRLEEIKSHYADWELLAGKEEIYPLILNALIQLNTLMIEKLNDSQNNLPIAIQNTSAQLESRFSFILEAASKAQAYSLFSVNCWKNTLEMDIECTALNDELKEQLKACIDRVIDQDLEALLSANHQQQNQYPVGSLPKGP